VEDMKKNISFFTGFFSPLAFGLSPAEIHNISDANGGDLVLIAILIGFGFVYYGFKDSFKQGVIHSSIIIGLATITYTFPKVGSILLSCIAIYFFWIMIRS
jgi:hypothetical protein